MSSLRQINSSKSSYPELRNLLSNGMTFKKAFEKIYASTNRMFQFAEDTAKEAANEKLVLSFREFKELKDLNRFSDATLRKIHLLFFNYLLQPQNVNKPDSEFINFCYEFLQDDSYLFIDLWMSLSSSEKKAALKNVFNKSVWLTSIPSLKLILQKLHPFEGLSLKLILKLHAQYNFSALVKLFEAASNIDSRIYVQHLQTNEQGFVSTDSAKRQFENLLLVDDALKAPENTDALFVLLKIPSERVSQTGRVFLNIKELQRLDVDSSTLFMHFLCGYTSCGLDFCEKTGMSVRDFRTNIVAQIPPDLKTDLGMDQQFVFRLTNDSTVQLDPLEVAGLRANSVSFKEEFRIRYGKDSQRAFPIDMLPEEVSLVTGILEGSEEFSKETLLSFLRLAKKHFITFNGSARKYLKNLFFERFPEETEALRICYERKTGRDSEYLNRVELTIYWENKSLTIHPIEQELLFRLSQELFELILTCNDPENSNQGNFTTLQRLLPVLRGSSQLRTVNDILWLLGIAERFKIPYLSQMALDRLKGPSVVSSWVCGLLESFVSSDRSRNFIEELADQVSKFPPNPALELEVLNTLRSIVNVFGSDEDENENDSIPLQLKAYFEASRHGDRFDFNGDNAKESWLRIKAFSWLIKREGSKRGATLTRDEKKLHVKGAILNHLISLGMPTVEELFDSKKVRLNGNDSIVIDFPTKQFLTHSSPYFKSYFLNNFNDEGPLSDLSLDDWNLLMKALNSPEKIDPEHALTLFSLSDQYQFESLEERAFQSFKDAFEPPKANDFAAFSETLPLLTYPQQKMQNFYKEQVRLYLENSSKDEAMKALKALSEYQNISIDFIKEVLVSF